MHSVLKLITLLTIVTFSFINTASARYNHNACNSPGSLTVEQWNEIYKEGITKAERNFTFCKRTKKQTIGTSKDVPRMFVLAELYAKGLGTKKDHAAAISWYTRVYEQKGAGNFRGAASNGIGDSYSDQKKYKKAMEWYKKTVADKYEKKRARAQNKIGYMYEYGLGVEVNYVEAKKLYTLSANTLKRYYRDTEIYLTALNNNPGAIAFYKGKADQAKKKRQAAEKKRLAAEKKAIQHAKEICYSDTSEAKERYTSCLSAARNGDPLAKVIVAKLYLQGPGVKINYTKSIYWYKEAIKDGGPYADHAKTALAVAEQLAAQEKKQAKAKERERLANTWLEIDTNWNSGSGKFEVQCKAGKSPAEFAKSMGTFGNKTSFKDEVSENGKVMEVTVLFYNFILKQNQENKFFRGLGRCETAIVAKNRQREANKRALDKYR